MLIDTNPRTLPLFTVEDVKTTPDQFIDKLNQLVDIVQVLLDNRD